MEAMELLRGQSSLSDDQEMVEGFAITLAQFDTMILQFFWLRYHA